MNNPLVSIIMGSDSDLPVMSEATKQLEKFGIASETQVVSAHRTPDAMYTYAKNVIDKGIQVIIAGAGGAAHLPGMVASLTPLPVIGVPIKTKSLEGLDSLLSIVQMPPGVPVATVAINGAKNAALLAAQIIGLKDAEVQKKVIDYKKELEVTVEEKNEKLVTIGYTVYIEAQKK